MIACREMVKEDFGIIKLATNFKLVITVLNLVWVLKITGILGPFKIVHIEL